MLYFLRKYLLFLVFRQDFPINYIFFNIKLFFIILKFRKANNMSKFDNNYCQPNQAKNQGFLNYK